MGVRGAGWTTLELRRGLGSGPVRVSASMDTFVESFEVRDSGPRSVKEGSGATGYIGIGLGGVLACSYSTHMIICLISRLFGRRARGPHSD
eukprot:6025080-Pyramimonas_sp.AAC.4